MFTNLWFAETSNGNILSGESITVLHIDFFATAAKGQQYYKKNPITIVKNKQ